jgi:hypothetical protein
VNCTTGMSQDQDYLENFGVLVLENTLIHNLMLFERENIVLANKNLRKYFEGTYQIN